VCREVGKCRDEGRGADGLGVGGVQRQPGFACCSGNSLDLSSLHQADSIRQTQVQVSGKSEWELRQDLNPGTKANLLTE
jgi:hypothetical protein